VSRNKKKIVLKDILVADYAAEGKSLARLDGKVIFLENAVPGDIVDIQLTKNKKDWAEGHVINFHQYASDRLQPFCSHFGICGGCQWQMLPYEKQLFYKQQQVAEHLKRIAKVPLPEMQPIIGADRQTGYRNKIEYTFSNRRFLLAEDLHNPSVSAIQNVAGFHAKGIFDKVVDIETCYLQEEPTNRIRHEIKNWAIARKLSFYDIRIHEGWLRTMQVRICLTGEIMVNLVFAFDDEPNRVALLNHLMKTFPEITTMIYTINSKWNDSLHHLNPQIFSGKGFVVEKLEDFQFKIGPKSFFQTNSAQAEKLYQVARDFAELGGSEVLYDLYCGTGSIGIFCSHSSAKVIGVDIVEEAIEDAKENAAFNGIDHAQFFAGDVIKVCSQEFFLQHGKPDVIITDPPRAGMHEDLVNKIMEMEASRVVYVSCNPATQARDLSRMSEKYEVCRIRPVDMFPHTHHIENIVQLKLKH
jgi:23S rRNA (uracil1939-C5)-methyltransferase